MKDLTEWFDEDDSSNLEILRQGQFSPGVPTVQSFSISFYSTPDYTHQLIWCVRRRYTNICPFVPLQEAPIWPPDKCDTLFFLQCPHQTKMKVTRSNWKEKKKNPEKNKQRCRTHGSCGSVGSALAIEGLPIQTSGVAPKTCWLRMKARVFLVSLPCLLLPQIIVRELKHVIFLQRLDY